MENKINIAEILKDCPKGMELDCAMYDSVQFDIVQDGNAFPIKINTPEGRISLSKYGCYSLNSQCKCIIFPKGKTTWEGFVPPCSFDDGDIVATTNGLFIGIVEVKNNMQVGTYCSIDSVKDFRINNDYVFDRLATTWEKQKLFDAIKANGYKWNADTKTLEKLIKPKFKVGDRVKKNKDYISGIVTDIFDDSFKVTYDGGGCSYVQFHCQDNWELVPNKFDITTLKPFDKVLVRDNDTQKWTVDLFSFYDKSLVYPYSCVGHYINQCVPYEKNEHLLGTTNDCDEYFKTWE